MHNDIETDNISKQQAFTLERPIVASTVLSLSYYLNPKRTHKFENRYYAKVEDAPDDIRRFIQKHQLPNLEFRSRLRFLLSDHFSTLANTLSKDGLLILPEYLNSDKRNALVGYYDQQMERYGNHNEFLKQRVFSASSHLGISLDRNISQFLADDFILALLSDFAGGSIRLSDFRGYTTYARDDIKFRAWKWHHDGGREPERKVMILLNDVLPDHGEMLFLKSTERWWQGVTQKDANFTMEDALAIAGNTTNITRCYGKAGTIIMFTGQCLHRATRSTQDRSVLVFTYKRDAPEAALYPLPEIDEHVAQEIGGSFVGAILGVDPAIFPYRGKNDSDLNTDKLNSTSTSEISNESEQLSGIWVQSMSYTSQQKKQDSLLGTLNTGKINTVAQQCVKTYIKTEQDTTKAETKNMLAYYDEIKTIAAEKPRFWTSKTPIAEFIPAALRLDVHHDIDLTVHDSNEDVHRDVLRIYIREYKDDAPAIKRLRQSATELQKHLLIGKILPSLQEIQKLLAPLLCLLPSPYTQKIQAAGQLAASLSDAFTRCEDIQDFRANVGFSFFLYDYVSFELHMLDKFDNAVRTMALLVLYTHVVLMDDYQYPVASDHDLSLKIVPNYLTVSQNRYSKFHCTEIDPHHKPSSNTQQEELTANTR